MHYVFLFTLLVALGFVLWRLTRTSPDEPSPGRPVARGPIGPDDDPDFLLDLRRKNKNPERDS